MSDPSLRSAKSRLQPKSKTHQFRVGDKVKVRFGNGRSSALIIEDRGPIGVKGRRLVRVQLIKPKNDLDLSFEVPVEELTPN